MKSNYLRSHSSLVSLIARALDIVVIGMSGVLSFDIRFHWHSVFPPAVYGALILAACVLAMLVFSAMDVYTSWRAQSARAAAIRVVGAWLWVAIGLFVVLVLMKISELYSRIWLMIWLATVTVFLGLTRLVMYKLLKWLRKHGFNQRSVVVVGGGKLARDLVLRTEIETWSGFVVIKTFNCGQEENFEYTDFSCDLAALSEFVNTHQVDEVWIATPISQMHWVQDVLGHLRFSTANVRFVLDTFGSFVLNHGVSEVLSMPMIDLSASPMTGVNRLFKELEDRILASLILLLISPLMLAIAVAVKFSSPGPVFFRQERLGWNSQAFSILKFRSMYTDVEQAGVKWGGAQHKKVTALGAFLRRTSLDELPQFINVLKGDMSIVGPRPERPMFVEQFKQEIPGYMQKHMVKAGITGWAQIHGWRGDTDLHKRIQFDLYYIEHWSLALDIKIIFLTIFKGFLNKNAY